MKDSELYEEVVRLLWRIITRSDPGRLEAWAGVGLTMTQLRVLFLLREDEGMTARALAESLSVTPSTLTRIMDRLVRGQLVQREEDPDDRRLVRHYLTQTALDMVGELERTGRERMDNLLNRLSEGQLGRLAEALRDFAAVAEEVEAEEAVQGVRV